VHDQPARARSDAENALPLDRLEPLLRRLMAIDNVVRQPGTSTHDLQRGSGSGVTLGG
jgi:3-deoxy-D-manno-octulosonic acid (KDO) 8-phosphate synthase